MNDPRAWKEGWSAEGNSNIREGLQWQGLSLLEILLELSLP